MRFYAAGNYYLSSIQQGIQAAHALGEMVAKYTDDFPEENTAVTMFEWLNNHKTMVLLNGGNHAALNDLYTLLTDPRNTEFPVSKFHEDEQSLAGMLTCVAIILPERLYAAEWIKPTQYSDGYWVYDNGNNFAERITGWEAELLDVIKKLPLAR